MDSVRSLDSDLWVIDHPFRMPGGIELGARTTVIRLSDGGLWLHSPGPLTPPIKTWLTENGPVRAIVAPNLLHHLYLAETVEAFPAATVYGPVGMPEKVGAKLPQGAHRRSNPPPTPQWRRCSPPASPRWRRLQRMANPTETDKGRESTEPHSPCPEQCELDALPEKLRLRSSMRQNPRHRECPS